MNNTFTSDCFLLKKEINEKFLLEKSSNLTYEFLYENFNKKICKIFLIKIVIKMLHFQDEVVYLVFLQKTYCKAKVLKRLNGNLFLNFLKISILQLLLFSTMQCIVALMLVIKK